MPNRNGAKAKTPIDKLADAAMPKIDASEVSERGPGRGFTGTFEIHSSRNTHRLNQCRATPLRA
jgi:hypothetical protein